MGLRSNILITEDHELTRFGLKATFVSAVKLKCCQRLAINAWVNLEVRDSFPYSRKWPGLSFSETICSPRGIRNDWKWLFNRSSLKSSFHRYSNSYTIIVYIISLQTEFENTQI